MVNGRTLCVRDRTFPYEPLACNLSFIAVFFGAMNPSHILSGNRRLFAVTPIMMAFLLLLGCSKSEPERIVDAAAKQYGRIKVGMSKENVVARLGEPASRKELNYRWETVGDPDFKASLDVRFDGVDKVVSVAWSKAGRD